MKKIKIGLIGTGRLTHEAHIPNLNLLDKIEISALCNRSEANLKKAQQLCKDDPVLLNDYKELLSRSDVDAVIISTPNHTHYEMIMESIEHGRHVFCEKPMALTLEECDRIIEKCDSSGMLVQIGLELRYSDIFCTARKILSEGHIGNVRMISAKSFRGPLTPSIGDWRHSDLSGGLFLEKDIHLFDLINWFAGSSAEKVAAIGGKDVYPGDGILDNAWVIIEYRNKVKAMLGTCTFSPHGNKSCFEIIGDKGKMEIRSDEKEIIITGRDRPDTVTHKIIPPEGEREFRYPGALKQFEHFVECLERGRKPLTDPRLGKEALLVPLMAEEAVRSNDSFVFNRIM